MNHAIEQSIEQIIDEAKAHGSSITPDRAFSYMLVRLFSPEDNLTFYDVESCVTDGPNDGGIDFVIYDDSTDEERLIVGQSKMTATLDKNTFFSELDKMHNTVTAFQKNGSKGQFSDHMREVLSNGLDRLSSDGPTSIEYRICTTAHINAEQLLDKLDSSEREIKSDVVSLYSEEELIREIERDWESTQTVSEFKFNLDRSHNQIEYVAGSLRGAMVNISSISLIKLYEQRSNSGLFDLNIRRYIRSKSIDSGIKETLDRHRNEFWFLNNGLTIVCSDYSISGDKMSVYNFSIVNGGQTTYLIGNYKGKNNDEFFIPCKVVCDDTLASGTNEKSLAFFSRIAQATNSQKKISAKDLRSNSPEMRTLQKLLENSGIHLEIKRSSNAKKSGGITIKNEDFAQIYTAFVYQQPGTARNKKSYIFENDTAYARVFRQKFTKEPDKAAFIVDLIRLYARYIEIEKKLKGTFPKATHNDVFANGKMLIFALMGALYSIENSDVSIDSIETDPKGFCQTTPVFGPFISGYTGDDLDSKLESIIKECVRQAAQTYDKMHKDGDCTSVSNFLKSDPIYQERILADFIYALNNYENTKDAIESCTDIFHRCSE